MDRESAEEQVQLEIDRRDARLSLFNALIGLPFSEQVPDDVFDFDNLLNASEDDFLTSTVGWLVKFGMILVGVQDTAAATQAERDTLRAQRDAVREFFGTGERDLGMTTW